MNYEYIIEDKYNLGVGLVNVEPTQKLVKHFEFIEWNDRQYTLDIYENGLIKCNEINKISAGNGTNCFYVDETNPFSRNTIFSINITDGNKLDNIYLNLIEDIYRPLCERPIENAAEFKRRYSCDYDPRNKDHIRWWGEPRYGAPLLCYMRSGSGLQSSDYCYRGILLKETFETLKTIKSLYEINKTKIFKTPKQYVKLDDEPQIVSREKDCNFVGYKDDETKIIKESGEKNVEVEEEEEVKKIKFEGKIYLKSKQTGIIYNYVSNLEKDKLVEIGKWNNELNKIDYYEEEEQDIILKVALFESLNDLKKDKESIMLNKTEIVSKNYKNISLSGIKAEERVIKQNSKYNKQKNIEKVIFQDDEMRKLLT